MQVEGVPHDAVIHVGDGYKFGRAFLFLYSYSIPLIHSLVWIFYLSLSLCFSLSVYLCLLFKLFILTFQVVHFFFSEMIKIGHDSMVIL